MTIDIKSAHITQKGGNVFADLGFDPDEAVKLQAESRRSWFSSSFMETC
jgi:hypothetical protein